jgi:acetyl esterase/lipase
MNDIDHMNLWPGTAPGTEHLDLKETITERSSDPEFRDRIITGISRPSLKIFHPEKKCGSAVLIVPGGAYARVAIDKESADIARWLGTFGVTGCVLKYRLPTEGHVNGKDVPLQDAQRAIRLIRKNAESWGIDPSKVGAMGFSSGGHVVSRLGTMYNRKSYEPIDGADALDTRPDFMALIYPVISLDPEIGHMGSRTALLGQNSSKEERDELSAERHVSKETPPSFICHANDDPSVMPENSISFYQSLRKAGVSAELHIFSKGKHGFGIRMTKGLPVSQWTKLCENWMHSLGI